MSSHKQNYNYKLAVLTTMLGENVKINVEEHINQINQDIIDMENLDQACLNAELFRLKQQSEHIKLIK